MFRVYEFKSADELKNYPTFDKYEERESQARSLKELGHPMGMHLTCDIREVNRISASSGTTGTPSFQGHTRNDRAIIQENFGRLAEVTDTHPGDRVMMAGVMSMWVAGIPTVDALTEFGCMVIPIGGLVGTTKVIEMAQLTRPESHRLYAVLRKTHPEECQGRLEGRPDRQSASGSYSYTASPAAASPRSSRNSGKASVAPKTYDMAGRHRAC